MRRKKVRVSIFSCFMSLENCYKLNEKESKSWLADLIGQGIPNLMEKHFHI